ncbi:MAG: CDP-alcohol phosphatidyltransferase family protein [Eubacteriaceae bacterium]|nr:CDP-alcohol phosphatidyltransferase family protein [Eubacteriaceae bacterium]MDD4507426.1 CDP-alcohol phosphatidyltransferase family protein [Eubacteriaceae bacterium]
MEEEANKEKIKITWRDFFSIPNILTYFRFLLIPVVIQLYLKADKPEDYFLVAGLIALSGITDFLDGQIARRFNQRTELGVIIDPIADKLTQAAVAVMLIMNYPQMLLLFVLLAAKEFYLLFGDIVVYRKGLHFSGALWAGKVSTTVFFVTMFILVAFPNLKPWQANSLMVLTAVFLIISFVQYARALARMYRESKGNKKV